MKRYVLLDQPAEMSADDFGSAGPHYYLATDVEALLRQLRETVNEITDCCGCSDRDAIATIDAELPPTSRAPCE